MDSPAAPAQHTASPPTRAPGRPAQEPPRIRAVLVALACLALLIVGASLNPSDAGHGTHEQLGMTPCGWAVALDRPCPTCGMTTAVSAAADGNLTRAFVVQPFGALVALGAAALFWMSLHVAVFGSGLWKLGSLLLRPVPLLIGAGLLLGAWAYKIVTW